MYHKKGNNRYLITQKIINLATSLFISKLNKMKRLIVFLTIAILSCMASNTCYAQLRKTSESEKVKSFTNGSVTLYKTIVEEQEVYSVSLRNNNSKLFDNVILFLGNKEEMLKNLKDFDEALENGKKGESFEFSACGQKYQLLYHKVLGQICFKVYEEFNSTEDFGMFFKATILDITNYFKEEQKSE